MKVHEYTTWWYDRCFGGHWTDDLNNLVFCNPTGDNIDFDLRDNKLYWSNPLSIYYKSIRKPLGFNPPHFLETLPRHRSVKKEIVRIYHQTGRRLYINYSCCIFEVIEDKIEFPNGEKHDGISLLEYLRSE